MKVAQSKLDQIKSFVSDGEYLLTEEDGTSSQLHRKQLRWREDVEHFFGQVIKDFRTIMIRDQDLEGAVEYLRDFFWDPSRD